MPKKTDIENVYKDLKRGLKFWNPIFKAAKEDYEFALGKQWDDKDKKILEAARVTPLTINKIKPMLKIITGVERQSRTDYIAFPEGGEDELLSEIVTRLLKNVVKRSRLYKKQSEQFKVGMMGGLAYLEPYIDYTHDLINGVLKFRRLDANRIVPDPDAEEDDGFEEGRFLIKLTLGMSKEDLTELFPDKEEEINRIASGRINLKDIDTTIKHIQYRDYPTGEEDPISDDEMGQGEEKGAGYDLIDHYYKKMKMVFYVASKDTGEIKEFTSEEEAKTFMAQVQAQEPQDLVVIEKKRPEVWLRQVVGDVELSNDVAWSYPRWKGFPIIPFFAERMDINITDVSLLVQGFVRAIKDLQIEHNKSRTAEMRHLNTTANSGWMFPKGAVDPRTMDRFKQYGSSPGFTGEYDPNKTGGTVSPETFRIRPAPLPQGHMAISVERGEEIKQSSGINPDLLASDGKSQSGRAILLKQRQGLSMIQESLDNYTESKLMAGRFILSQLGEIYTVQSAMKVLGRSFIQENFQRQQVDEEGRPAVDEQGQPVMAVDGNEVKLIINKILNDSAVGVYDVSIGEGAYTETIKFTNFSTLMEMVESGVPIDPEIIVEESLLDEGQKKKILAAIEKRRQALAQAGG